MGFPFPFRLVTFLFAARPAGFRGRKSDFFWACGKPYIIVYGYFRHRIWSARRAPQTASTNRRAAKYGQNFSRSEGGLRRFLSCLPSGVGEERVLAVRSLPRRSIRGVAQHRTSPAGIFPKRMQIMGRKSGFRECRPPTAWPAGFGRESTGRENETRVSREGGRPRRQKMRESPHGRY